LSVLREGTFPEKYSLICSWHYSEERARERCKERMAWIEEFFEQKEPADDASAEIGYCCG
jgi:hypothetical protein